MTPPAVCADAPDPTIRCLLDVFSSLTDSRAARGRRYRLDSILGLVVVALLAGAQNPSQIYAFARHHPKLLAALGFRAPKRVRKPERRAMAHVPNEDTIANHLALVRQDELNEKFTLFLCRMVGRGATAAIDGKALRGTEDYILSVFVSDLCQVVWQEDVGQKDSELAALERALPELLAKYPQIRLFTGDAAFCHKSVARMLVKAKRDYFLQLKAPHKTDVALAEDSFRQLRAASPPLAQSEEKRGGRRGRKS